MKIYLPPGRAGGREEAAVSNASPLEAKALLPNVAVPVLSARLPVLLRRLV